MVEDTIAPPELEPYTPMTEVLESCPLALIEFVNGIYIYKIGTCGSGGITELGFATSMVQHELGCYDNVCVHPIETVLKTGETYSGGDRPASAGLGNGRGPIGTPPGQNKKLKAAATRRFSRMNERLRTEGTGDLAAHRNVKTSSGNNFCFPKAIEYGLTDETIWAKANKEYSVALGGGDGLSPAQKFGGFDDQPQRDLVSASGEIPRLVQVGVNGHNYGGGGGAVVVKLEVNIGGVTEPRCFRLLQTEIEGVTLYHGQECTVTEPLPDDDHTATIVDRHVFLHSIEYDDKTFLVTTVDPLLDDTM